MISDDIGVTQTLEIAATYSYKIHFDNGNLSFGLQAGLFNIRSDHNELRIKDPDAVFNINTNHTQPNFGAGIIYMHQKFMAGISIPRILNQQVETGNESINIYNRHAYLMTGTFFNLSQHSIFRPSIFFRYVKGAPISYDIRSDFIIKDLIMTGAFTRNLKQFGFSLGLLLQSKYRLIYQFELPGGNLQNGLNSHEITLSVDFSAFDFHNPVIRYF